MLKRTAWFLIFFLLSAASSPYIWGQTSFYEEEQVIRQARFYENVEVRAGMKETIMAPFFSLLTRQSEIHEQLLSPVAVEFELRKSAESFYLLFKNEQNYLYPVWGRGNYIIKRDLRTGDFQQIKIFFQNDENSFIRLFPLDEQRSIMDMVLYGSQLYKGIVIPVALEELALSSFSRLMHLTRGTVQWKNLFTDVSYPEWADSAGFVNILTNELGQLYESDDGAQDARGHFVRIEDGVLQDEPGGVNCSGFAKWVVDGILLGLDDERESLTDIEDLKLTTEAEDDRLQNQWNMANQDRDPYFGLDWTRNLALTLNKERAVRISSGGDSQDVKDVPFFDYRQNIGYDLENIRAVLYLLAIENPGAFYMGAINSLFGEDPVLWQFHHVTLFFPWFTDEGDFMLSVLETGCESSLENLKLRYPDSFVHLVELDRADAFIPANNFE
ncbi:MAG: hypothetical protein B6241_01345 [Spirochaetaceae bacterium 4572_59]|nr:MAG: hypothetical protein B6241_01345 [Spirochaetaceae bacterium 4572_59]